MSDIDRSKAPEGYPIWIECLMHANCGSEWHKDAGDCWVDQSGGYWLKDAETRGNCKVHYPAPQWSGSGLPPVGTVCEVDYCEQWHQCEVIAHFQQRCGTVAAFTVRHDTGAKSLDAFGESAFRPIRTEAQIAAEEREKVCEAMLEIAKSRRPDPDVYEAIAALYDAGYRKQEAV